MTDQILQELKEIKTELLNISSPVIPSKAKAAKFIKKRVADLEFYVHTKRIKKHTDKDGNEFYLKDELLDFMRSL